MMKGGREGAGDRAESVPAGGQVNLPRLRRTNGEVMKL